MSVPLKTSLVTLLCVPCRTASALHAPVAMLGLTYHAQQEEPAGCLGGDPSDRASGNSRSYQHPADILHNTLLTMCLSPQLQLQLLGALYQPQTLESLLMSQHFPQPPPELIYGAYVTQSIACGAPGCCRTGCHVSGGRHVRVPALSRSGSSHR